MWKRLSFTSSQYRSPRSPANHRQRLRLERLEEREVPAVTILIDYSHDTSGFFANNPTAQATLQYAADLIGNQLNTPLAAINSRGGDTWSENFFDPATGNQVSVNNPSLAANTIVLYAGARVLGGSAVSVGGAGGFSANGDQNWLNAISTRGPDSNTYWGGIVAFNTTTNWYFGQSASGLGSNQMDFFTCASHELMNALGVGTSSQYFAQVSNNTFTGSHAESVYGGPVPVTWGGAELADVNVKGVPAVKNLDLSTGVRTAPLTALDWALLQDVGWVVGSGPVQLGGVNSGGGDLGVGPSNGGSSQPSVSTTPTSASTGTPVLLTGPTSGTAQAFLSPGGGQLTAYGNSITPFPGWTGSIRSAVGDFITPGVLDYAFAPGPGGPAEVVVFDAATGTEVIPPTTVLGGFTGGVYLAAGDVNRSGVDVLAVSADAGGGNRIEILAVNNGQLTDQTDFLAFGDPAFRGGARIAFGDVNGDGVDDLIVGAGIGGSPRVAIYDGNTLLSGNPGRLVPDFYALDPSLRTGVFVAAADLEGNGYADVIYSTGDGGGPRVMVVSGAELVANPGVDADSLPALANFFALDPNNRDGLRIVARDVEGTGQADLIVATGAISGAEVRVIPLAQMEGGDPSNPILYPFGNAVTANGIYVG